MSTEPLLGVPGLAVQVAIVLLAFIAAWRHKLAGLWILLAAVLLAALQHFAWMVLFRPSVMGDNEAMKSWSSAFQYAPYLNLAVAFCGWTFLAFASKEEPEPEPQPVSEEPKGPPPLTSADRVSDVALGLGASIVAILVGFVLWAFLFDRAGGEPFAGTMSSALVIWPFLVLVVIGGPIAWWHFRGVGGRVIVFICQVFATAAAIGSSGVLGA